MANTALVKELRALTGLSFKEINQAIAQAGGDKAKALTALQQLGAAVAEKKSARATGQGVVEAYVHADHKLGALVELRCETDFVARNPEFKTLAHDLAMHVAAMAPSDSAELLAQPFIKDPTLTIQQWLEQAIAKLGENIKVGQFIRLQL